MDLRLTRSINISLKQVKSRVYALFARIQENPRIKRQNVRLMIGNGVSVLVITVIQLFNCTRINVKAKLLRFMKDPKKRSSNHLTVKLLNGLNQEVYLSQLLPILRSVRVLNICRKPVNPRTR